MTIKRGLVLAKYGTMAATTRQRVMQVAPYLRAQDIEIDIAPLFDNAYLEQFVRQGKRSPWRLVRAYMARLYRLLRARQYDFLWVQYELFPYLPGWCERIIGWAGKPIIYDIDDAIFHQYDQHRHWLVRRVLGQKLKPLLQRVDMAFCGNRYLQAYVARYVARTEIVPTTVDTEHYLPLQKSVGETPVLGWIGSPSTWRYCLPVADLLSALVTQGSLLVRVIGAGHASTKHPFEFRQWVEAHEIAEVQQMDIGIMPLPDEPWARGKCGYKLIQYMACGLPVIASPVGVNSAIVEHGVNGFLVSSQEEWRVAIEQLRGDPALREQMGKAGRKTVEQHYAIQQYGPFMAQRIQALLASQL